MFVPAEDYDIKVSLTQGKGLVVLEMFNERSERSENQIEFNGRVTAPDTTVQILNLRQTAPNRYEAAFDVNQTGAYLINISKIKNGETVSEQSTSLVSSYAPEFATINPDIGLLKRLADDSNGIFNPTEKQIGHHSGAPTEIFQSLWGLFALCAALLFVLELIIRRLQISKSQLLGFRISDFGFRNCSIVFASLTNAFGLWFLLIKLFFLKEKFAFRIPHSEFPNEGLARLRQRKAAIFSTEDSLSSQFDRIGMKVETDIKTQQSMESKRATKAAPELSPLIKGSRGVVSKSDVPFTERLLKAKKRANVGNV